MDSERSDPSEIVIFQRRGVLCADLGEFVHAQSHFHSDRYTFGF